MEPTVTKASATIVVVDDNVLIRMPIGAYLRECGYRVVEACSIDEATLVLAQPIEIDAILLDVQTTGRENLRDGFALAQWLRSNRPEIKLLLAADPKRIAQSAGKLCEEGPALSKPYDPQLLLDHIRRVLAARPNTN